MKKIIILIALTTYSSSIQAQHEDTNHVPFMLIVSVTARVMLNTSKSEDQGHLQGGYDSIYRDVEKWHLGYRPITSFSIEGLYYLNERVLIGLSYERGMLRSGLVRSLLNLEEHAAMRTPLNSIRSSICFYGGDESNFSFKYVYYGISFGYMFTQSSSIDQPIKTRLGIDHFKALGQFTLGLVYKLQLPIGETGFYLPIQLDASIPIAGNLGTFRMKPGSDYAVENKVRIFGIAGSVGLGYRFGQLIRSAHKV